MDSETCPKCGADEIGRYSNYLAYACASSSHDCGATLEYESHKCTRRQLDQTREQLTAMTKERDDWHEDRDHTLLGQRSWMEMVEELYPDEDFGESLAKTIAELKEQRTEGLEQARLLGMGGEREARLMAELEQAKEELSDTKRTTSKLLDNLWQLIYPNKTDWEYSGVVYRHIQTELEHLRERLANRDKRIAEARTAFEYYSLRGTEEDYNNVVAALSATPEPTEQD